MTISIPSRILIFIQITFGASPNSSTSPENVTWLRAYQFWDWIYDSIGSGSNLKQMKLLDGYWASDYLLWDSGLQGWKWSDAGSCCGDHHSRGTAESLLNGDSLDRCVSSFCLGASECHEHIWIMWNQTFTSLKEWNSDVVPIAIYVIHVPYSSFCGKVLDLWVRGT